MQSFSKFIFESTLHAFDIDETLFAHDPNELKIHVKDQSGKRVKSLTNQEFNHHVLQPGHSYDFSEFKSADKLNKSAKPIRKMLAKMKAIHNNGGKTEILTARSDFDDQPKFKNFMGKYGVDINKIHIRRAGNLGGRPAQNKKAIVSQLIRKHGYKAVHLYDDSKENLNHFLSLKHDHPDVTFHAHHVDHDEHTGHVKVTTTTS